MQKQWIAQQILKRTGEMKGIPGNFDLMDAIGYVYQRLKGRSFLETLYEAA